MVLKTLFKMMNNKFKVVFFFLVFSASVCSFIFLNFCAPKMANVENQPLSFSEQQVEEPEIEMPDLKFVDHFIKVVKKVLPAH